MAGSLIRRWRRAVTLLEVMVASTIGAAVVISSVGSIIYYQRVTNKNERVVRLTNLMEGTMERIYNKTWYQLSDASTGIFPPGGPGNGTWPAVGGTLTRRECTAMKVTALADASGVKNVYTGINGKLQVFYTPYVVTHQAEARDGATLGYDVHYYKVEVIVTLDDSSRIRPGTDPDVWTMVSYVSELGGRSDAEFAQSVLQSLRDRQYPIVVTP